MQQGDNQQVTVRIRIWRTKDIRFKYTVSEVYIYRWKDDHTS